MSSIPKTPVSIDSEKALLGSLIIDSESWEKISNLITPTDFYDVKNRDCLLYTSPSPRDPE